MHTRCVLPPGAVDQLAFALFLHGFQRLRLRQILHIKAIRLDVLPHISYRRNFGPIRHLHLRRAAFHQPFEAREVGPKHGHSILIVLVRCEFRYSSSQAVNFEWKRVEATLLPNYTVEVRHT
ncbi:hypothetical protein L596_028662 [Steinernema carpocapsae]|uniref:Uncharacterized protein n=1 Tax=Steinernema carpocapsae TaxID=34508 RepID=A0A4U5LZ15_STECR|nr:hypothetical protein L596_028662 [Steinernema carpocapsae]